MTPKDEQKTRYYEATGKRKTSVARVRIYPALKSEIVVNNRKLPAYFKTKGLEGIVNAPLTKANLSEKFKISIKLSGGGTHSQSEAAQHGIARALILFDTDLRVTLKKAGYLKRDSRMKERKKFGKKKARKSPQWSKR